MATAPQTAMEMPQQGANPFADPNTMAVYEQMRQTVSPKAFGDQMLASAEQAAPEEVAAFRSALEQIQMPPEALDLLNNMVDEILANPGQYAEIRAKYKEMGAPDEILPEQFDAQFFTALNMAVDQMIGEPAGVQAFAKGGIAELTPISKAIANYGRNGDTMLAHITPAEARMLRRRGGSGTINPKTGLPEFFNLFKEIGNAFKSIGNAVKSFVNSTVGRIITTVALGFFLGPAAASFLGATSTAAVAAISGFVGSAGSTLLGGGNISQALKAGAIGGLTAGAGAAVGGAMGGTNAFASGSYTGPTTIGGQVDRFTGMFGGPTADVTTNTIRDAARPAIDASGNVQGLTPTDSGVSDFTAKKASLIPDGQGGLKFPPGQTVGQTILPDGQILTQNVPDPNAYTGQGFGKPTAAGLQPNINVPNVRVPVGMQLSGMPQSMIGMPTASGVAPPIPSVGDAFKTIGQGLGIGEGNTFNVDKLMQGGKELFSPSLTNEQLKLTPE